MPKPEQSAEPSIEEILASIRRIIADDGAPAKGPGGARGYPKPAGDPYRDEQQHGGPVHRTTQAYQALGEMPEPRGEDELLELTEDFLLEEAELVAPMGRPSSGHQPSPGHQPMQHGGRAEPADIRTASAAMAPLAGLETPVDPGLHSVFSSVAAEVERLAAGEATPVPASLGRLFGAPSPVRDEPIPESRARAAAPAAPLPSQPEGLPQPEARPTPIAPAAPAQQQAAPRQRTHSRPVWSARRLEGGPAPQPAAPDLDAPEDAAPPQSFVGRDRWEEGVQMPVPESGPQIPFPYAPELEPKGAAPARPAVAIAAAPVAAVAPREPASESPLDDLESEKNFVGDFLSRVFGGAHAQTEEPPLREEPGFEGNRLKGKAEMLAKATLSDFASDKLKAPSLADALQADKPFMAQLTDSLETALAEVETLDELDDEPARGALPAGKSAAPFIAGDEMPEPPPLIETDLPFAVPEPEPASRLMSAAAPQQMTPTAPSPTATAAPKAQPPAGHVHPDPIFEDRRSAPASQMPAGIEDSIKELIKPLIVQWLNENLSRIVEQAVREELAVRKGDFLDLRIGGSGKH